MQINIYTASRVYAARPRLTADYELMSANLVRERSSVEQAENRIFMVIMASPAQFFSMIANCLPISSMVEGAII